MAAIRRIDPSDITELKSLWSAVFHDDELFLSAFFSDLASDMDAFAAVEDGQIVGSAYVLNILTCKNGDTALPCPYIYAVGVHPEFRGQGIGKALTLACREYCEEKYGISCIVPADEGLFDYYKRIGYVSGLYVDEYSIEREGAVNAEISEITPEEYGRLREQLLAGQPHMEYCASALRFLSDLCEMSGGGLYLIRSETDFAIAAAENSETMFLKELLCSDDNARGFAAALLWQEDGCELTYRTPAKEKQTENAKAIGMLSKSLFDGPVYMGPAFD